MGHCHGCMDTTIVTTFEEKGKIIIINEKDVTPNLKTTFLGSVSVRLQRDSVPIP